MAQPSKTKKVAHARARKYMTLKIALCDTDIARTVVVPDDATLTDLSDAIRDIFGWHGGHIWEFRLGRNIAYAEPSEYDSEYEGFCERRDSNKTTLAKAFPERGSKMGYLYDMGDGWDHLIARMADPKDPGTRCTKSSGTFGIDDIGGSWGLVDFTRKLKAYDKNPSAKLGNDFMELLEWSGFDEEGARKDFLECPNLQELTDMLQGILGE